MHHSVKNNQHVFILFQIPTLSFDMMLITLSHFSVLKSNQYHNSTILQIFLQKSISILFTYYIYDFIFSCECLSGFQKENFICVNVNECEFEEDLVIEGIYCCILIELYFSIRLTILLYGSVLNSFGVEMFFFF